MKHQNTFDMMKPPLPKLIMCHIQYTMYNIRYIIYDNYILYDIYCIILGGFKLIK